MAPILRCLWYHMSFFLTFTHNPMSIIVPGTSTPLMITFIAWLWSFIMAGPLFGFVKIFGASGSCSFFNIAIMVSMNHGTNYSNRVSDIVKSQSVNDHHTRSSVDPLLSLSCSISFSSISSMFFLLAFPTHCCVVLRTTSCASHSIVLPFTRSLLAKLRPPQRLACSLSVSWVSLFNGNWFT